MGLCACLNRSKKIEKPLRIQSARSVEMKSADSGLLQWTLAANIHHLLNEHNMCLFYDDIPGKLNTRTCTGVT